MTSRLPESVIFKRLANNISKWRLSRRRRYHLQVNNARYCRESGAMVVTNVESEETHYPEFDMKCIICGRTDRQYVDSSRPRPEVGSHVMGRSFFDKHEGGLVLIGIMAFVLVVVSAIVIPINAADNRMEKRLAEADKKHVYASGEKALCNVMINPDDNSNRTWLDCTVVAKTLIAKYSVKYINPANQKEDNQEIRAIDMKQK